MGTSDYRSLLGNREGLQQGWNFDSCKMIDPNDTDRVPRTSINYKETDMVDIDNTNYSNIFSYIYNYNDGETVDIENAELVMEFMLCEVKTDYNGCYMYCDEATLRRFERKFMKEVYPHCVSTSLGTAVANCGEWEFEISRSDTSLVDSLNIYVLEYMNAHPGIFKIGNYLKSDLQDSRDEYFNAKTIYSHYDENTCEVWCRVMYRQVYEGLVRKDISKISDECLVHICNELGIENALECSVQDLFDECVKIVHRRYYPKRK